MWIVNLALRRPYTFIVAALLILLATPYVLRNAVVDVLPEIDIPVASILLTYNGLSAKEMGDRIVTPVSRNLTNTVSDVEHIESQAYAGLGVIKVFFRESADIATSIAQLTAAANSSLRSLPPGIAPPQILRYSATNLPILQLGISSPSLSEQELNEVAFNSIRTRLLAVNGTTVTAPFGGKFRLISVDLDSRELLARGMTAMDVVNAVNAQNLTLPMGTARFGGTEYNVALNGSPTTLDQLGNIPVSGGNGVQAYLRDIAHVRDGFSPQTNIVRRDGERGLLMTVLKNGNASTLDIIRDVLAALPAALALVPPDVNVTPLFDQSVFVRAAVSGVVEESVIAACLTAILLLLFLGNWRSTAIISLSIPLSILCSIIALHLLGESLNIMTLGGLAISVGILVDDATVTIENIETHLHKGKSAYQAILDGAAEIATPAFVSTLCICIVFLPMFFLAGIARHLFVPMALAVIFAMVASYILSRTLVPTLAWYLMRNQSQGLHDHGSAVLDVSAWKRPIICIHREFDQWFERLRVRYRELLQHLLLRGTRFALFFIVFCGASVGLYSSLGQDFFPVVDAGQIRLHVRAPVGTRIEEMPPLIDDIHNHIRSVIPQQEIVTLLDNIGGPYTPINTLYNNSGTIDTADAELMISLAPGHKSTHEYIRQLRLGLPGAFPGVEFFFQPADLITQSLNFGVPAPIDIQISGTNSETNLNVASELVHKIRQVPGAVDVHIYQRFNKPTLELTMDRARLRDSGLDTRDVAQNLLINVSSSFQTSPSYWLNPTNGNVYNVAVQSRYHEIDSLESLLRTPVGSTPGSGAQLLGNLVQVEAAGQMAVASRYNNQPVINIYSSVAGRDLGSTYRDIRDIVDAARAGLPRGSQLNIRGQVETMHESFTGLIAGSLVAVVLVYLLIVINFQSWLDALIIISALPAALAGIAWILYLTGTTLSVPALTGVIMTIGVATANSILLVSFARDCLQKGANPREAALQAGASRLRPVLMTASAMVIGMIPMAMGWSEGGSQNAPLGRAVIGGLLFATVSTLLFVPLVFAAVHGRLGYSTQYNVVESVLTTSR